jgi:hypothetical protein
MGRDETNNLVHSPPAETPNNNYRTASEERALPRRRLDFDLLHGPPERGQCTNGNISKSSMFGLIYLNDVNICYSTHVHSGYNVGRSTPEDYTASIKISFRVQKFCKTIDLKSVPDMLMQNQYGTLLILSQKLNTKHATNAEQMYVPKSAKRHLKR